MENCPLIITNYPHHHQLPTSSTTHIITNYPHHHQLPTLSPTIHIITNHPHHHQLPTSSPTIHPHHHQLPTLSPTIHIITNYPHHHQLPTSSPTIHIITNYPHHHQLPTSSVSLLFLFAVTVSSDVFVMSLSKSDNTVKPDIKTTSIKRPLVLRDHLQVLPRLNTITLTCIDRPPVFKNQRPLFCLKIL